MTRARRLPGRPASSLSAPGPRFAALLFVSLLAAAGCAGSGPGAPTPTPTGSVGPAPIATETPTLAAGGIPTATTSPTAVATASPTDTPTPERTERPTAVPTATAAVAGGPIAMRRLTAAQYRASIADALGPDLVIAGRLEPDNRRAGLLAIGASYVSVTAAGFEQYEAIARTVAEQALDPIRRDALVPCAPESAAQPDDACAEAFVRAVGGTLLRRTLTEEDLAPWVTLARAATAALGDFYGGLEATLAALLVSPEFLFRVEVAEPDPRAPGRQRLTNESMAARLSYLLWNTTPDAELLAAAAGGELTEDDGLARQVDRLLASPRLEAAVRAFFSDLYGLEEIEEGLVRKDPALFPAFSQAMINDAREQTLRVIADHLLVRDGDYRGLFTTRHSFMTRTLGVVYRVPVRAPAGWEAYDFPAGGPRAGLLTHVSLLALRSHPGRSSPTLRGKFVREVLLCTDVPPPPGDIDFSMFAEEGGADRRTARERLTVHVTEQVCAGCHALMDPIGLALEQLDGIGAYRETENGAPIDPSGELNGVRFADAADLGAVLSRDAGLGPCFVESLFRYAVGRDIDAGEWAWLSALEADVAARGYRWRDLLRAITLGEPFRTTSGPRIADAPATPTASPETTPAASRTPTARPEVTPTHDGPSPTVPPQPSPSASPAGPRLQPIQDSIFTPRCATQYCHSAQARAGNLVLDAGAAFANLVGVDPANAAARTAGMRRVEPYSPDDSFLLLKVSQPSSATFGARMPLIGAPLDQEEIDAIRAWILAGANP